ncbi:ras GTPase-activating protein-binding protein 1-like [Solea solea]|uniref:ras GTPase-activating protein-binding protein 1-like n=1 Tax=Solea solea TaxID=90069 RepID=UPI00272B4634|nr:ras GTPase-activating protein-binding protein 1-like [Solea solea]
MVMEKPSAQLVGLEFVRQYYTLLNQAPDYLHRFYVQNSSYVHGGLDSNGKPVDAVYGQSEIHKRVMALSFRDCHAKIRHVDAHATLSEGVVVQVMGELSNNMQPMRKFMQTFVLAPEHGSDENKFYVHNDVFRYQDEVFGDSDSEPPEESEDEVEEIEESAPSAPFYDPTARSEPAVPDDEEEAAEPEAAEEVQAVAVELEMQTAGDQTEKSSASVPLTRKAASVPAEPAPEQNRPVSWATVASKNLPPKGAGSVSRIPPLVVKSSPTALPRAEVKPESQTATQRPQRDQRPREQRPGGGPPSVHRGPRPVREGEHGEPEGRRVVRYPDTHQLFVGNVPHDLDKSELREFFEQFGTVLELRINNGGKLPNFAFVVFDNSEPVQKILSNRPIKFRGNIRLNVEEKKTHLVRDGDQRDTRYRGSGGPSGDGRGGLTTRAVREGEQGEAEGRRGVRYPDAHQLFVGNVPHDVEKNELREFFEQFGTVLELRINSGGKLPNFGFVVFDDSETVEEILNNRPIRFRGNIRLNVEEKKTHLPREGERRDARPRGPGSPSSPKERIGGGGAKPSFSSSDGRYSAQRQ